MSRWDDEDGEPLGSWERITYEEYLAIIGDAGGIEELTVFATLTDPDGVYGQPRIYTAWGRRDAQVPLIDRCDENAQTIVRKFVARDGFTT